MPTHPSPRRQHRPRRHHPQRARRTASRSGAAPRARRRGRRRRHHRPSARGSPAHLRRRHRAALAVESRRARSTWRWRRPTRCCAIALRHQPHAVCLVPERREERTTEGGLDAVGAHNQLAPFVASSRPAGIRVSLFIEPDHRPGRGRGGAGRAGGRTAHRRLVRRHADEPRRAMRELARIEEPRAHARSARARVPRRPRPQLRHVGPVAAIPRSSSSTSATS